MTQETLGASTREKKSIDGRRDRTDPRIINSGAFEGVYALDGGGG